MQSEGEFVAKTHAQLAGLTAEAKQLRRNRPTHAWCPDTGGCRPCRAIRDVHRRIDDCLLQLEGKPAESEGIMLLAVAFYAPNVYDPTVAKCSCGRMRVATEGFLVCTDCDAGTVPLAELMDSDDA